MYRAYYDGEAFLVRMQWLILYVMLCPFLHCLSPFLHEPSQSKDLLTCNFLWGSMAMRCTSSTTITVTTRKRATTDC